MNKPKIRTGSDLTWYCECGYALGAIKYPIDLTKDSVELSCDNEECKFKGMIVGVKLEQREVLYIKEIDGED